MSAYSVPSYDFFDPQQILFGWGRWREVGPLAATLGRRAFLVLGSRTLAAGSFRAELRSALSAQGVAMIELAMIAHEPEVTDVDLAAGQIRAHAPTADDLVI